ncbi:MAG: alpha-galactosidase [Bryobacteraceae bacterium]|nr:alpha-galactosidase [Bryobacteraceae bacterium]MDW8378920.1 alpha-galactosidase [Bryobacterales bacterium]
MKVVAALTWLTLTLPIGGNAQFHFQHTPENHWVLSNGWIEAEFQFTHQQTFEFVALRNLRTGDIWKAHPALASSPVRFASESEAVDAYIPLRFVQESIEPIPPRGMRQNLVFDEKGGGFRIFLALELYDNEPVLRYSVRIRNLLDQPRRIRMADMLSWNFEEPGNEFRLLRVNQWSVLPPLRNFEPQDILLPSDFRREFVYSGAGAAHCAWLAVRDRRDRGLIAGWEFDGRTEASARYRASDGRLQLSAFIESLNRYVTPGGEFQVPPAFIGLFRGNWDEAGFRTQRFVERVLAKRVPEEHKFPYVVWDSWGYQTDINESLIRRNADIAARLGMEMVIVDLGWSRTIGDWRHDPVKFPNGLAPLADYVHSLGMKFGLHLAIAEAALDSPVAREHPEWLSTEPYSYFGAKGLCLSHKPVQQWLIQEIVRVIDEYQVDWILQDGEHLVKRCTRRDHTHDPDDSNYSNAVDGLNAILEAVQKLRPAVLWENCANGGSMMTFNMVKYYVTSITNDASGALGSRQAVFGATFPFPARYTDRYMPEQPSNTYITRSYMFGGPWIFMNKLEAMSPAELALAANEIRTYKAIRPLMRDSKIFHLTDAPLEGRVDAIEAYSPSRDTAVVVITRDGVPSNHHLLRLEGLNPESSYRVRFQDDRRIYVMTGRQLLEDGVPVVLPAPQSSEIVYIEPADLAFALPD